MKSLDSYFHGCHIVSIYTCLCFFAKMFIFAHPWKYDYLSWQIAIQQKKVLQPGISYSTQKDPVADRQCVRSSYSTMTQWKGFPFQHFLLRVGISLFSSFSFRWLAKQKDLQFSVLSKKIKGAKNGSFLCHPLLQNG